MSNVKENEYSTFPPQKNDQLKEPMFLGENVNVARFDQQKYPIFEKLTNRQLSYYWRPDEVDVTRDKSDFISLSANEQHIFLSNLKYQILLDSVQGRAPSVAFIPIVSLPELENFITTWTFSESIHSRSYTYIIRNALPKPDEIFNDIVTNEEIKKRALDVTKYYDDLINYHPSKHTDIRNDIKYKEKIIICMASVYILEAIRFYVSFACSWAFAERGRMEGNAKIIRLIARDEFLHFNATAAIFTIWKKGKDGEDWVIALNNCKDKIKEIVLKAVQQEKDWADYLFKDGSMIGLNKDILSKYIEYLTDQRISALGIGKLFSEKANPIPWIDHWLQSDNVQVAPQETEIPSYLVSSLDTSVNDKDLDDLDF